MRMCRWDLHKFPILNTTLIPFLLFSGKMAKGREQCKRIHPLIGYLIYLPYQIIQNVCEIRIFQRDSKLTLLLPDIFFLVYWAMFKGWSLYVLCTRLKLPNGWMNTKHWSMFTASPDKQTGTADRIFAQRKGQKRGDG